MARQQKKRKSVKPEKKSIESPFKIYWEPMNYYILFGGFALMVAGYFIMNIGPWDSTESLVIAPVILFIIYVVVFPLSILYRKKKEASEADEVS